MKFDKLEHRKTITNGNKIKLSHIERLIFIFQKDFFVFNCYCLVSLMRTRRKSALVRQVLGSKRIELHDNKILTDKDVNIIGMLILSVP